MIKKKVLFGMIIGVVTMFAFGCDKSATTVKDTKKTVNESVEKANEGMKELQRTLE